ncbi:glycosyltransferase 87 family protein [Spongisporangium articulatum]|uniref:Glycosyltransferase 87 family protein n=1 Tax=Spongisporangium articulatum TaxID=3362603 RepID=A0ABW8AIC4_9ACTN
MTGADTSRAALRWRLLGVLVLALSAAPLARHYLVEYPQEIWQVDLQVYREGAKALVTGFPLYEMRTDAPQFLPFTYPPFAALTALPLLVLPFHGIAWAWTVLQFALLWYTVGVAFRPFTQRFGERAGLVQGMLAAGGVWLLPVAEGIRYGQVNCVIVALCLWDVTRRATVDRGGSGVGVALAAAVKLTPGVFWLHWAVARRWRTLAVSLGTVVGVTAGSFLLMPNESMVYFTDALTDPGRLGPNAGTSNQSLRGTLLRIGPAGLGGSLLWLAVVVVVLYFGLRLSRRLDALGEPVAVVAACGMLAYLVSPVSWVHHMHWIVVVLGALLGDGRDRRRVVATVVGAVLFWCRLPWWGANLLAGNAVPNGLARVVQSSYTELAVVALLALWLLIARPRRAITDREPEEPPVTLGT